MSRKVIAFAGSKGAGKTTAFEALRQEFKNGLYELTLAGHLKKVCAEAFKIDESEFHDPVLKEAPLEDPIYIEAPQIDLIIRCFGYEPEYNDHIRPFVGTVVNTRRQLLQFIGTDVLHKVDKLIHVNYAAQSMPKDGLVVITDLRFLNEFDYFNDKHKDEFVPFYIKNHRAELAAEGDTHPSEKQLLLFRDKCEAIDNNSDMVDFQKRVVSRIKELV